MTEVALEESKGFGNLGLNPKLVATLTELGYEEPTPIQREAIPPLLTGADVIGQAATGTGKTAAFALPILQRIAERGTQRPHPSALVLVPTRELAMQVAEAMHKYGHKLKIAVVPIYGGHSFGQQQRMLERGVDVVVATPGRAVDHIGRKTMDLSGISILALDEADEMLDMGFADDLETILSETPAQRQTVFFSATLPPRIAGMVKRHMNEPLSIKIVSEPVAKGEAPKVRQTAYIVPRGKKLEVLSRILDLENPASTLVFCRTRTGVWTTSPSGWCAGISGSGLARRHHAGPADAGHQTPARGRNRPCHRDRRGGTRAGHRATGPGGDLRRTHHAGVVPAPHRPGWGAGREGVSITLADPARIAVAPAVRAADEEQDRACPGPHRCRHAGTPARIDAGGPSRGDPGWRIGPLPRGRRIAGAGARPHGHCPGRGQAGPPGGRRGCRGRPGAGQAGGSFQGFDNVNEGKFDGFDRLTASKLSEDKPKTGPGDRAGAGRFDGFGKLTAGGFGKLTAGKPRKGTPGAATRARHAHGTDLCRGRKEPGVPAAEPGRGGDVRGSQGEPDRDRRDLRQILACGSAGIGIRRALSPCGTA